VLYVAGHPTRVYRTPAGSEKQQIDFDKVPKAYIDLGISSYAVYEWHCWLEVDKLSYVRHTVGDTRQAAEQAMAAFASELEMLVQQYLKTRPARGLTCEQ
jgi:hypothetical protein